tara:strand:- start:7354 stop:7641 length:288 start_codon:yes stop_codon:yes gene_type:complete
MLESIDKCECGAVTINVTPTRKDKKTPDAFHMAKETFEKHFSFLGERDTYKLHNCNHCINRDGIDIDLDNAEDENGDTIISDVEQHVIDDIKIRL